MGEMWEGSWPREKELLNVYMLSVYETGMSLWLGDWLEFPVYWIKKQAGQMIKGKKGLRQWVDPLKEKKSNLKGKT